MAEEARGVVAQGAKGKALIEQHSAFARYLGQGYEIAIALPAPPLQDTDAAALRQAFEHSYLEQYGPCVQDQRAAPPSAWRDVFDVGQGAWIKAGVYRRSELPPGSAFPGPAIIVEESTSTVIGPHYDVAIAADASIVMTRRSIP